jgi:hypothetical protein
MDFNGAIITKSSSQFITGDCFTIRSVTDGDGIYITTDSWLLIQILE